MANRWATVELARHFPFLGSKITADGDCSHEIKWLLHLGRKAMANLDSILKSRDITLPTKVCLVQAMAFPGIMYWCESWTIKKAEHQRIDAFELWCSGRFLSSLDCREINPISPKGNQLWIFTGRTDVEAELQYFGHLMRRRTDSFEKTTLKEISPEYSLEGLMLKPNSNTLATWCEELTHLKRP